MNASVQSELFADELFHCLNRVAADFGERLPANRRDRRDRHRQRLNRDPLRLRCRRDYAIGVKRTMKNAVVDREVPNVVEEQFRHSAGVEREVSFLAHGCCFPLPHKRARPQHKLVTVPSSSKFLLSPQYYCDIHQLAFESKARSTSRNNHIQSGSRSRGYFRSTSPTPITNASAIHSIGASS